IAVEIFIADVGSGGFGTAAVFRIGRRAVLQVERVAVIGETRTAGDVAARVAAITRSELARRVTLVDSWRALACAFQNASGHGCLLAVRRVLNQQTTRRIACSIALRRLRYDDRPGSGVTEYRSTTRRRRHARLRTNAVDADGGAVRNRRVRTRSIERRVQRPGAVV